eukprot:4745902-Pyramimonas_sp.AAC.1
MCATQRGVPSGPGRATRSVVAVVPWQPSALGGRLLAPGAVTFAAARDEHDGPGKTSSPQGPTYSQPAQQG